MGGSVAVDERLPGSHVLAVDLIDAQATDSQSTILSGLPELRLPVPQWPGDHRFGDDKSKEPEPASSAQPGEDGHH